jgi:hypothetical protein
MSILIFLLTRNTYTQMSVTKKTSLNDAKLLLEKGKMKKWM